MFDKIRKYCNYSYWSNKITDKIYANAPKARKKSREVVEYGAYMVLSETTKIGLLLILAGILHVFKYVLIIMLLFGFLRWNLGGIHAKSHWACMISFTCFMYGILAASLFLTDDRLILNLIVIPFAFVIAYLYAPADLPVKPVVSIKQRKRLRITGFISLAILFITAQFVGQLWYNIIMLTSLLVSILMTPPIYKLTKNKYAREEVSI